jgi:hypothetical protein
MLGWETRIMSVHRSALHAALIVLPALLYLALSIGLAVNVPVGDDFVVLDTVSDLHAARDWQAWWTSLVAMHNEHRLVTTRLLAWLTSALPNGVDFIIVSALAQLALVASLVALGATMRLGRQWRPWAVLMLCVMHPQLYKLMFYPMSALQAFVGLLLSLSYLYAALIAGRHVLACALAISAILTTGGGLIIMPLGCAVLLLSGQFRPALGHACVALLSAWLYLHGEARATGAAAWAFEHPFTVVQFFLGLFGSAAEIPSYRLSMWSRLTCPLLGLAVFGYAIVTSIRMVHRREVACDPASRGTLACLWLCLTMAVLVVVNRSQLYADDLQAAMLDGRYRLYGLLATAIGLVDLTRRLELQRGQWRRLGPAALATALALNLWWTAYRLGPARETAHQREQALQHWFRTGDPSGLSTWAVPSDEADRILRRAVAAGIFRAR